MTHWDVFGSRPGPICEPANWSRIRGASNTDLTSTFSYSGPAGYGVLEGIDCTVTSTAANSIRVLAQVDTCFFWTDQANDTVPFTKYFSWRGRVLFAEGDTLQIEMTAFAPADLSIFAWGQRIGLDHPSLF